MTNLELILFTQVLTRLIRALADLVGNVLGTLHWRQQTLAELRRRQRR